MIKGKIFPIKTATACQLKWTWSTLWLHTGETLSCHRAGKSLLTPEEFSTFHNTPLKIAARETMLEGKWPGNGCEYCKQIEDAGGSSDRMLHLNIPNLTPPELDNNPTATTVSPRILEIYLNNTCNLQCVYCYGGFSSKINFENTKFANSTTVDLPSFEIIKEVNQPAYLEKFWEWMNTNSHSLVRIHLLGGEPFYQREFDDFLEFFERTPHPHLEFNIVTNLSIPKSKLENYMNRFKQLIATKKIKRLDLTCSIDCWGSEQEFVRYGLNLIQWEDNFNYLLTLPWLVLNINQTISPLTIKTMPALLIKLREWKKVKSVQQYFSGVTPGPDYLKPTIFGSNQFNDDFEQILSLMPMDTHQEREARVYMQGIWQEIKSSTPNAKEIANLKLFLNEIDRRRGTNWRELFPWIS